MLGIDLAKHIFSPHGVDSHGKTVFQKREDAGQKILFSGRESGGLRWV